MENQSSYKMRKINNINDVKSEAIDELNLEEKITKNNLNKKQNNKNKNKGKQCKQRKP